MYVTAESQAAVTPTAGTQLRVSTSDGIQAVILRPANTGQGVSRHGWSWRRFILQLLGGARRAATATTPVQPLLAPHLACTLFKPVTRVRNWLATVERSKR